MPTGFCKICNETRQCVIDPYGDFRCWWCNCTVKEITTRVVHRISLQTTVVHKIPNFCIICQHRSDQNVCFKCQKMPHCPNCNSKLEIEIKAQTATCSKCHFVLTASKKRIAQLNEIRKEETGLWPVLQRS